jgi:hypothetical protein
MKPRAHGGMITPGTACAIRTFHRARRSHHTFAGHFSDALVFPATAVHEPLTFRAVVTAGSATVNLDYAIEVIK